MTDYEVFTPAHLAVVAQPGDTDAFRESFIQRVADALGVTREQLEAPPPVLDAADRRWRAEVRRAEAEYDRRMAAFKARFQAGVRRAILVPFMDEIYRDAAALPRSLYG